MDNTVLVALIFFSGTLIGTLGGIIASGKLTAFRLKLPLSLSTISVGAPPII